MLSKSEIAKAINEQITVKIRGLVPVFGTAVWNNAEVEDANLSNITYRDTEVGYVPKLSGVTPSAGGPVLVMNAPGLGIIIIGVPVGDRTIPAIPS